MMRVFHPRCLSACVRLILLCAAIFACASAAFAQSQSNAADLQGFVRDPQGAVVQNATVTARNPATNTSRTAMTNDEGFYQIVNLPPGDYELTVEAPNFKRAVLPAVKLTVGQRADLDIPLELGQLSDTVTVTSANTEVVETSRTAVATTIDQQRIENLPINERNYLSFALTTSTVSRDNGRPIGPAPTSGLNFGGQRGRSNLIQVDGADNTDNSVNASRSTVSQEAVQEFQVVSNSYAAEFGRSAGGVVNVVTKSGTNDVHGNVFGFLRNRRFQARNAFAPIADPPFTRTQYGATLGGPLKRDRTFAFFAFEQRRRNESGFFTSSVSQGLTSSVTIPVIPAGPGIFLNPTARTFGNLSPAQVTYINNLLATGTAAGICGARAYAFLASSGGSTGLTGINPLFSPNDGSVCPAISPILPSTIGSRFLLSGAPVPINTVNAQGQPIAFRPLLNLQKIFPITERTSFTSFRLDHNINKNNLFTFRFGYNPSDITGIQVESQNQSLGQNDFSRTGVQNLRDFTAVVSLNSTLSDRMVNEARINFGERRAIFKSQNGDAVAVNVNGAAFFGRELFSPVNRTETRYQYTDTLNLIAGNHTLKFGADVNYVNIPSAVFELNFAGLFNFGGLGASSINSSFVQVPGCTPGALNCAPDFTPVQQYGLGVPSTYIQGFGNPVSRLSNKPLAFFGQDSWKLRPNLTLNYGLRYDVEYTQQIAPVESFPDPLSGITLSRADLLAAQNAINVQQGFPRDKNNFAPRFAIAWDPMNNGKTVIRAAYGLFYDHPLLAVGFNSDIADAAQQQQFVGITGSPSPTALLNATQIFQGTVCNGTASGAANPLCLAAGLPASFVTPGVASTAQYQFGRQRFNDQTFPGFGAVLPFTLPVSKDFEYAYANQANFTVERQLTKDMSLSASYLFVGTHHLPHPLDINAPQIDLQVANFRRFANRAPTNTSEVALVGVFPTTGAGSTPGSTFTNPFTGETFATVIPGLIVQGPRGRVISPAAANFFRPNAPNYFLVQALTGLTPAVFNTFLAGTLRTPGVVSPFGSVNAQVSDGNSNYNALNVDLKRRFANNFQFLASYTWSHSIDDSSDLQTLLLPQDNRNFRAERADSLFDQRHRFVFSAVIASPAEWRKASGFGRRFLADFIVAPIFEISSGRPFNILSGVDTNNDQSNQTDRPNVGPNGVLLLPAPFTSGDLGRSRGITHPYSSLDLRLTRALRFGERWRIDLIAEGFNLFNRFNEAAASPLFSDVNTFNERAPGGRYYSRPTAAFDPRQFQFGLKINF
ncbi:MAG TPA: TonB-dependent receptor [Pyrinomonadaceae bacterium]|nr:TonB-dependent receptor [Pyrinomonadaceae bacterium]